MAVMRSGIVAALLTSTNCSVLNLSTPVPAQNGRTGVVNVTEGVGDRDMRGLREAWDEGPGAARQCFFSIIVG